MNRFTAYKADLLLVAGFILLPLLLFGQVTLGDKTMLPADNLFQWPPWADAASQFMAEPPQNGLLSDLILENYPWRQFIRESLAQRQIPLWNPHIFAGTPFLATGQHSAYYPFSIIFLILPLAKAFGWYTISQLWLAGTFTYVLARVVGQRRASAFIAGLIFQGCGFLLVSAAVFPMILGAAIWLPLLLACIELVIRQTTDDGIGGTTLPWAALGAVALGLQILAGHIEITYYTLLIMAFFAAWRVGGVLIKRRREGGARWIRSAIKPAVWLLALVLVGLMLGAVQFVPFVEVGQANFREGSATLTQIRGWAFPARRLVTFFIPDFYGNPADHQYLDLFSYRYVPLAENYYGELNPHGSYSSSWGIKNYVEGGVYLGVLTLFLAGLGLWSAWRWRPKRRPQISFFTLLAILSLAFIFGTPLYGLLYYGLPGINQLHSPFRWVFPLSLSAALLAGFGMDFLAGTRGRSAPTGRRPRLAFLSLWASEFSPVTLAAAFAFWSGLLLIAGLVLTRLFYESLEPAVERFFLGLAQAADAFPNPAAFFSYEFQNLLIFGLLLLAAGCVLRLSRCALFLRGRPLWEFLAALVIGLDLLVIGYGFNAAVDPALLEYRPELITWLEGQPGLWRLTTFTPHDSTPLNANTPWSAGLQDIRGYDSVILKQYTDYMTAIEPQDGLQFNRVQPIVNWESLNSPLLDQLGVKYVITAETLDLPKLLLAWEGEGLRVYENLAAVPRAYTIPNSATAVVDDALAALQRRDPRQFVLVEAQDWTGAPPDDPEPGALAPAEITAYSNIEVIVQAQVEEASWLVLNDTYFQGWDVFVRPLDVRPGIEDGEVELTLTRVNGNFRGVQLAPGTWEVRFRYSPLSFKLGGLTSFIGGVILLFAGVVWTWRRYYRQPGELSASRSVAKNSLAPMALNLFNKSIDFAFAAFYLRLLGPADSGRYFTAIIIASWFEIISNFGLNTLVIREVSRDRSQAGHYLLNTSILRLGTGLIGLLPVLLYLASANLTGNPLDAETTLAIFLLMAGMIFSGISQSVSGLYYAFERAEFPAAVTPVTTILKVALGVIVLLLGYGFVGLAGVSIAVNLVTLLILTVTAFRHFNLSGPWQVNLRFQWQMIGQSYPLMLNHLLAVIFFQIDVPLLRQINGESVVGWYNSAYKWVNAFNIIPSFFTFALFPIISRQVQESLPDARRTFRLSIKLMVLIALPLAATTTLLANLLIGGLGGREFLPHGAVALQLVIWSIPLGWINSVTNYVLIALGVERRLTWAFMAGVGFNIVANLIFLPRFSYLAASITTILSEVVLLALFAWFLRPVMPGVRWLELVKRPLAITGVMLWLMWLGSQVHLLLGLAVGLAVYPLGLWWLKVIGPNEQHILGTLLPDRLAERLRLVPAEHASAE